MAHKISLVEGDLVNLLNETFTGPHRRGYITIDGVVLPEYYKQFADAIENFEVHDDDVWVCTYPKCGTTWTQEMVWCIANDLDFERAKEPLINRFPFLESTLELPSILYQHQEIVKFCIITFDEEINSERVSSIFDPSEFQRNNPDTELPRGFIDSVDYAKNCSNPRLIKTHLPYNLLPRQLRTGEKSPKIICVVRNPKDVCISYYHHCLLLEGYHGSFEEFCNLFLGNKLPWMPFWTHILGYWKNTINDNLLFLKYEDMKKDLPSVIRKTAKFLGKNLTSDQVSSLNDHLSFESMKGNPSVNFMSNNYFLNEITQTKHEGSFVRCGKTEQWKSDMSHEMITRFDDWTRKNLQGECLSL